MSLYRLGSQGECGGLVEIPAQGVADCCFQGVYPVTEGQPGMSLILQAADTLKYLFASLEDKNISHSTDNFNILPTNLLGNFFNLPIVVIAKITSVLPLNHSSVMEYEIETILARRMLWKVIHF